MTPEILLNYYTQLTIDIAILADLQKHRPTLPGAIKTDLLTTRNFENHKNSSKFTHQHPQSSKLKEDV